MANEKRWPVRKSTRTLRKHSARNCGGAAVTSPAMVREFGNKDMFYLLILPTRTENWTEKDEDSDCAQAILATQNRRLLAKLAALRHQFTCYMWVALNAWSQFKSVGGVCCGATLFPVGPFGLP